MYYVYLLQSKKFDAVYVGSTNDLRRRFGEHNSGKEISTKRYMPWRLVSYEAYKSEKDARLREQKLKQHGNAMKNFKLKSKNSLKMDLPSTIFSSKKNSAGFTLFEILIAITISVAMLSVILSIYSLTMRSIGFSQDRGELSQNSRIIIERLTRDIRQAKDIATILPEDKEDILIPPPSELEIRDGHETETFQYIKYYLSSTNLHRQIRQYYFADEPNSLVPFDAEDDFSNPALINIIEDELVGQYISNIIFYGTSLITTEIDLEKGSNSHSTKNTLFGRNL